ncbi:hypothetical protein [Agromyces sp. SYSU T00194]|uniref:hypothetical protein n=1 Tax=Agromyces chitinivorans TaxID=3158560 RepID=UPI00339751E1
MTELSPEEKAEVARFGIHNLDVSVPGAEWFEGKPESMACEAFMGEHEMTRADFGALLREYRSETGWMPYEARNVLGADFLNWHEWERLG